MKQICSLLRSLLKKSWFASYLLFFCQSQPLLRLGASDGDEEEIQLKWLFLVHHPCDLETMERKTKEHKYKTLEEFRGDAATIQHNVHIVFGGWCLELVINICEVCSC
jgi:Bromodomain